MNNKMMMMMIGVVCLLLVAFGAMMFMMWSKMSSLESMANATGEESSETGEKKEIGPIYSLESFIVNLDDPKYRKYLRVTMDLELRTEEKIGEVEDRLPQIRDCVLTILPAKQYEQVTTVEGKNALRKEIQTALNAFFDKEIITNIYFTEFVIQ